MPIFCSCGADLSAGKGHTLTCGLANVSRRDVALAPVAAEAPLRYDAPDIPDLVVAPVIRTGDGTVVADGRPAALVDQRRVAASRAVDALLAGLGVPRDEHTANTPDRVARAFLELLAGYSEDPDVHLDRRFPGPDNDAGLVVCRGVRFTSLCAHHLLPFTGTATVAYLPAPGSPIVGLSKLARLLEGYARRLQTQEVLGAQVADALDKRLSPLGAACIITAHHACMGIRGVRQPDAEMVTSALRGVFRDDLAARAELTALHEAGCRS